MKFGVSLAHVAAPPVQIDRCLEMAQSLDAAGFDSVWVNDHVALPVSAADGRDGAPAPYEPLMLVSALASLTQRIAIGTCVLTLPFRHPAITAKMLAAADLLSGGRVILGVGEGGSTAEFAALNLPSAVSNDRLGVMDEYLRAIKEMWLSTGPSNFAGQFVSFRDVGTFPKPARKPHPRVMVAGESSGAMVLASRQADMYLAPFAAPEEFAARVQELRAICRRDRRDPAEVEIAMLAPVILRDARQDGARAPLTGATEQVWQDLRLFGKAGLDHLIIMAGAADDAAVDQAAVGVVDVFATEILPAFGRRPADSRPGGR